jgi:hypothetical protein
MAAPLLRCGGTVSALRPGAGLNAFPLPVKLNRALGDPWTARSTGAKSALPAPVFPRAS